MKRKLLALAALAALLLCALGGAALAEPTPPPIDTMTTDLRITFQQLVLFITVDGASMDIDFGEQPIPTGDTFIPATDYSHTLYVGDRRTTAGVWSVSAQIGAFQSEEQGSFVGTLQLHSPELKKPSNAGNENTSATLTPNLTSDDGGEYIPIGSTAGKVADATKNTALTDFSLTFTKENTRVVISSAEAVKVRPVAYTATVTWTLSLTPP